MLSPALIVALSVVGSLCFLVLLPLFLLNIRWKPGGNPELPPLTKPKLQEVVGAVVPLLQMIIEDHRCGARSYVEESKKRLPAPPGVSVRVVLARMLEQPWAVEAQQEDQLRELPLVVLLSLRKQSTEPQDLDREAKWPDAPPPTSDSAGHGMEKLLPDEHQAVWKAYKDKCKAESQGKCLSQCLNHYKCVTSGTMAVASEGHTGRLKNMTEHTIAVMYATVTMKSFVGHDKLFQCVRVVADLPKDVRKKYDNLTVGCHLSLMSPTSVTVNDRADSGFMGDYPAFAVVFRFSFPTGTATGVDMRKVSMWPPGVSPE